MKDLIESIREIFPDGSDIQSESNGDYNTAWVDVPMGKSPPLRPEKAIRRHGHDVHVTVSNEGDNRRFGIHQHK